MSESSYTDFHRPRLQTLENIIGSGLLSQVFTEEHIAYLSRRLDDRNDPLHSEYFDYYLFFECMYAGIIGAFVLNGQSRRLMHQFGILNKTAADIEALAAANSESTILPFPYRGEENLSFWFTRIRRSGMAFTLMLVFPQNISLYETLGRIEKVFLRFYVPDAFVPDARFVSYFDTIDDSVKRIMRTPLLMGQPVSLLFFRFRPFQKYLRYAGEHFAADVIDGILTEIRARLKGSETVFVLSPREYLVIFPGSSGSDVTSRFRKIIIRVKSIVLDYITRVHTITEPVESLVDIWEEVVAPRIDEKPEL